MLLAGFFIFPIIVSFIPISIAESNEEEGWWVETTVDRNGDGIGDLKGLTKRLSYLRWLGIDAVWLTPIFPSPLEDGGYDITDFKDIHSELGDLSSFHRFLQAAHELNIKVILDLVLNHTSTLHPHARRAGRS